MGILITIKTALFRILQKYLPKTVSCHTHYGQGYGNSSVAYQVLGIAKPKSSSHSAKKSKTGRKNCHYSRGTGKEKVGSTYFCDDPAMFQKTKEHVDKHYAERMNSRAQVKKRNNSDERSSDVPAKCVKNPCRKSCFMLNRSHCKTIELD
ncbi:MAG: hypothetical protein KC493_15545 [Bacteriovoracaceae bacterium]|nr:hypothetical protein [Bacteriovoracaceae bacterium]